MLHRYAPGGGFSELLSGPGISWRRGDGRVNKTAGLELNDDKDVEWPKQEVMHHREVTAPNIGGMVLQESGPSLA